MESNPEKKSKKIQLEPPSTEDLDTPAGRRLLKRIQGGEQFYGYIGQVPEKRPGGRVLPHRTEDSGNWNGIDDNNIRALEDY